MASAVDIMKRTTIHAVRLKWGDRVFQAVIRKNVDTEEASSQREAIFEHAPLSRDAHHFDRFIDAFIARWNAVSG